MFKISCILTFNFLTITSANRYAIAVLPEDYDNSKTEYIKLSEELKCAGYKVKNTTVGDEGFKVEILNNK